MNIRTPHRPRQMMLVTGAVALALALTACQTTQDKAKRTADISRDIQIAQAHFSDAHKQVCIADLKRHMHDPSSFELAGPLSLDRIATEVSYGINWDYRPPRRVIYSARFRGKNKLGGLVLNVMECILGVTDTGISFAGAKSR